MKIILIFLVLFINSCSTMRKSAGVERKSIDEFSVVENPPLVIPPDYNLLPPEQLIKKKIDNIDSELAQEILFGLDQNQKIQKITNDTMGQILYKAEAYDVSADIKDEIDRDFMKEINGDEIFQFTFENEIKVLDAVKESERIRNKKFEGESIANGEVPTKNKIIKKKKKKRFWLF